MQQPKYLLIDSNYCPTTRKERGEFEFNMSNPINGAKFITVRQISFSNTYSQFSPYFYVDIAGLSSHLKTPNDMAHSFVVYHNSFANTFLCDMTIPAT